MVEPLNVPLYVHYNMIVPLLYIAISLQLQSLRILQYKPYAKPYQVSHVHYSLQVICFGTKLIKYHAHGN